MVKLIDGLEARGLVERIRNPDDRRAYALHATRAGLESMTEMLPRMARAEAELTAQPLRRRARAAERAAAGADRARRRRRWPTAPGSCSPAPTTASTSAPTRCSSRSASRSASSARSRGWPTATSSQRELADRLQVSTPVVVELVDALEARGLVERRRDPADRRLNALHVTGEAATCWSALPPCCWPRTRT